jgi:hypothetical protein
MLNLIHETDRLILEAGGELTQADLAELEQAVQFENRFHGPVTLLVDLQMLTGTTLDGWLAEWRFLHENYPAIERIAVVVNSEWQIWHTLLTRWFMQADIRAFTDRTEAETWLANTLEGQHAEVGA